MGIIKTAMLSGAGIYAVNRLAKTAEHRRETPSPSRNQDRESRPQYLDAPDSSRGYYDSRGNYYLPAPQQQQGQARGAQGPPMQFDDRRYSQQQQDQPLYLQNNSSSPLPWEHNNRQQANAPGSRSPTPPGYVRAAPPPYQDAYGYPAQQQRQQQQTGYVEADEVFSDAGYPYQGDRAQQGGGGSRDAVMSLAQQFMGGDDKGKGKGKDFMKMLSK